MSGLTFPTQASTLPSQDGLGIILVAAAAIGSNKKKRRKRRKRRAARRQKAILEERKRRDTVLKLQSLQNQNARTVQTIVREIQRTQYEQEASGRYAGQIDDEAEASNVLRVVGSIEAELGDFATHLSEYQLVPVSGSEPLTILTAALQDSEAAKSLISQIHRSVRAAFRKSLLNTQAAKNIVDKEALEKKAAKARAERESRKVLEEEAYRILDIERARVREQDNLARAKYEERKSRLRRLRQQATKGFLRGEGMTFSIPAPYVSSPYSYQTPDRGFLMGSELLTYDPESVAGLGGMFSDLFGGSKRKAKKRKKRRERAEAAAAATAATEREIRKSRRLRLQLLKTYRAVNDEALQASSWIDRIRRAIDENPSLPPGHVESTVMEMQGWESALQEISSGIGEVDIATEDPREQSAFIGELQAGLAAVRVIRIRASAAKRRLDTAATRGLEAQERLNQLRKRSVELQVRESSVVDRLEAEREEEARYLRQQERFTGRRDAANMERDLNFERRSLTRALQRLRDTERRNRSRGAF